MSEIENNVEFKKIKADSPSQYSLNLKKSLALTLFLFNLIVFFSVGLEVDVADTEAPDITINVENIPITHQTRVKPPPPKPSVPIPSEDESIPEDATIQETTLKNLSLFDDEGPPGMPSTRLIPPKPIAWVFPEYPEEEKKKGVQGIVKLSIHIDENGKVVEVVVLDNTTNSEKCAQAAIEAAYGSRFRPARDGIQTISFWLTQPYRFDITN